MATAGQSQYGKGHSTAGTRRGLTTRSNGTRQRGGDGGWMHAGDPRLCGASGRLQLGAGHPSLSMLKRQRRSVPAMGWIPFRGGASHPVSKYSGYIKMLGIF